VRRLKKFIIIFCLALAIPLGYFIIRTHEGLRQEEMGELRFFTETLLDRMEEDLDELVRREESRSIDEYSYYLSGPSEEKKSQDELPVRSPLSKVVQEDYILGYFQIGPDGAMQTPLLQNQVVVPVVLQPVVYEMRRLAASFNGEKSGEMERKVPTPKVTAVADKKDAKQYGIGSRYLKAEQYTKKKSQLGREKKRIEKVSAAQVKNITQQSFVNEETKVLLEKRDVSSVAKEERKDDVWEGEEGMVEDSSGVVPESDSKKYDHFSIFSRKQGSVESRRDVDDEYEIASRTPLRMPETGNELRTDTYRVEVDPLQSVEIDANHVFIFRRIVLDDHIYRQGFVLKIKEFLDHLGNKYFRGQPLARFASLNLSAAGPNGLVWTSFFGDSISGAESVFHLRRVFPRPFSFISAGVSCDEVPESAGRKTVVIMMGILAGVVLLGLLAIYRSAWVVMEMSRRRTGFVSSVTHELKTPLTNIRMYIEMLEHGIAGSEEREADYFRILRSESERLTRLINNVLEFSKLEKKQRRMQPIQGNLDEVVAEVRDVMGEKLKREGFSFFVEKSEYPSFYYDREAMIQILINLMDNSIKFGKNSSEKKVVLAIGEHKGRVRITLSDTGPGLPASALKRIFEEFYRVDNSLTRSTKGTGIGLALVKKLTVAMHGEVGAENNSGTGCTITLSLPIK